MEALLIPPYPLYNTTYSLYRLSPLHHGGLSLLHTRSLHTHARRLKEQLAGDHIRGVSVDFAASDTRTCQGALQDCRWTPLGDEDDWIDHQRALQEPAVSSPASPSIPARTRGVQVSIEYEKQLYSALLLRDPAVTSSPQGFTWLPLLLVRMSGPVRDVFLNYLRIAFDAYVVSLNLSSAFVASTLETYLRHLSNAGSMQSIQQHIRQLHLQLSFPASTALLKHVDVTIAAPDVLGFVNQGRLAARDTQTPFTSALFRYLKEHLALNMHDSRVLISRISCHSFHLSTDRLKLAAPGTLADTTISDNAGSFQDLSPSQLAVQDFYAALVREAAGSGAFMPGELARGTREETPLSAANAAAGGGGGGRKRASSHTETTNDALQKRVKAKAKENGSISLDKESQ